MRSLTSAALIALLTLPVLGFADAPSAPPSARAIIAQWRRATHQSANPAARTAHAHYTLTQDGLTGSFDEWITPTGLYRNAADRQYDSGAHLLTPQADTRRDWDGYVRSIDGAEAKRLHTDASTAEILAFGPPDAMASAIVGESDDHTAWTLAYTAPGAGLVTWYIDRQSGLPQKSVTHGGNDRDVATTYSTWHASAGPMAPAVLRQGGDLASETLTLTAPLEFARTTPADFAPLTAGPADTTMASDTVDVPFTMAANHIILPVSVNGRPAIGFIFDTGDESELINTARLGELGVASYGSSHLEGGGGAQQSAYCRDIEFVMGGVGLHHQHATVLDLSGLERIFGVKLGGVLGYDFISRFVIEIDYPNKTMRLHRPETFAYHGQASPMPITFDDGIPYGDGSIAVPTKPNILAHFILDFGASDTMILTRPFVQANDLLNLASTNRAVNTTPGAQQFYTQNNSRGRVDELHLGAAVQRGIPVSFSANTSGAYASPDFAGTIGEGIYSRYHVFLDYSRRTLTLESTATTNDPFHERVAYGLTLLASEDLSAVTAASITANSPAATQGFQAHDLIATVDGHAVSVEDVRGVLATGGHHVFVVNRAGQTQTIAADIPPPR